MTATHPSARLLMALLQLGQDGEEIDLFTVSDEAGLTLFGALRGLSALAERGLVSAARMRLTLSGLSLACSFATGETIGLEEPAGGGVFRSNSGLERPVLEHPVLEHPVLGSSNAQTAA